MSASLPFRLCPISSTHSAGRRLGFIPPPSGSAVWLRRWDTLPRGQSDGCTGRLPDVGSVLCWIVLPRVAQLKRAFSSPPACFIPTRMTSADFCPVTGRVSAPGAPRSRGAQSRADLPAFGGFSLAGYVRFAPIPQVSRETSATQPRHLPPGLNDGTYPCGLCGQAARLTAQSARGSRCVVPARPTPSASYVVLVHWLVTLSPRALRSGFALVVRSAPGSLLVS